MNVLVLAAHPDDEVLGCGGSIARFVREGHDVRVMCFTDGAAARQAPSPSRVNQLVKSSKVLGFSVLNLEQFPSFSAGNLRRGFEDNMMDDGPILQVIQAIEAELKLTGFVPNLVMTHSPWCLNVDHRVVFQAAVTVFRGQPVKLMCFEVPSSSEWNPISDFRANCHVILDRADMDAKRRALVIAYSSELRPHPHPRSVEMLWARDCHIGSQVGAPHAEQFMIFKEVM